MRAQIAMDQCANVMVLCDEDSPFCDGLSQQGFIARICRPLAYVNGIMAGIAHCAHCLCHDVGIGKDTHAIRRRL